MLYFRQQVEDHMVKQVMDEASLLAKLVLVDFLYLNLLFTSVKAFLHRGRGES